MQTKLDKFMECINVVNKDFSTYEDEKGNYMYINTVNLLCRVEVLELSKEEYQVQKFENKIDNLEYELTTIKRPVSKYSITKKEEDKYTITDSDVSVRIVYNVVNGAGIHKSFTNKEEALEFCKTNNEKIFTVFK